VCLLCMNSVNNEKHEKETRSYLTSNMSEDLEFLQMSGVTTSVGSSLSRYKLLFM